MNGDTMREPAFTVKEMLVRVDGKLDVIASKQQNYDIELALLKARVGQNEVDIKLKHDDSEEWRDEVRAEIAAVKDEQNTISARQKATAIIVAAIVIITNLIGPLVLQKWFN